jgi:hypothetical protein
MKISNSILYVSILGLCLSGCSSEKSKEKLLYGGGSSEKTWQLHEFYIQGDAIYQDGVLSINEGDSMSNGTVSKERYLDFSGMAKEYSFSKDEMTQSEITDYESRMSMDPEGPAYDIHTFKLPPTSYVWELKERKISFEKREEDLSPLANLSVLDVYYNTDYWEILNLTESEMMVSFESEQILYKFVDGQLQPETNYIPCLLVLKAS